MIKGIIYTVSTIIGTLYQWSNIIDITLISIILTYIYYNYAPISRGLCEISGEIVELENMDTGT
jgi:hypothetical protein